MHLHNEKIHFNGTHPSRSRDTSALHGKGGLMPTPHAGGVDKIRDGISGQRCVLEWGDYNIRLSDSHRQRNEANALIRRMYSWRGYNTETSAISSHNQMSLEAFSGTDLVATLALGLDSTDGLLADELYKQEINTFRIKGRKICELSKLAVDPRYSSKELLASLFNLAYIYARSIHGATDFFAEVNPRHSGYYKRMLGFRQVGETRKCERVNAPAVLLHLELDYVDEQVSSLAGRHLCRERSLYPYFLPQHEEKKMVKKIWHVNPATAFDSPIPVRLS